MQDNAVRDSSHLGEELAKYILIVLTRWWLVLGCLALAILGAFGTLAAAEPIYQAVARIAVIRSLSDITLGSKYRTLSEADLAMAGAGKVMDSSARISSLAALVENSAVAARVVSKLGDSLPAKDRDPVRLMGMVKGSVRTGSDLIEIKVQADQPQKAADIANAWAKAYEEYINELYAGRPAELSPLQSQVQAAKAEYGRTRDEMVAYIKDNEVAYLSRKIAEKQQLVSGLNEALLARTQPLTHTIQAALAELPDLYATKRKTKRLLGDARALRDQVARAGPNSSSGSAGLAIALLKAEAFASSQDLPTGLQLRLEATDGMAIAPGAQLVDLDALVAALEARLRELEPLISQQTATLERGEARPVALPEAPLTSALEQLEAEVRGLQARFEEQDARKNEIKRGRDTAQLAYETVANKLAEAELSAKVTGSEVRFASPALVPGEPAGRGPLPVVALAGILGLLVGVGGAFLVEYLSPYLSKPGGRPRR